MFVVPEDAPDRNASVALVKAFSHIYHEDSPGDAIAFLAHVGYYYYCCCCIYIRSFSILINNYLMFIMYSNSLGVNQLMNNHNRQDVSALSIKGIDIDSVRSLLSAKFSRSTVEDMMSGEGSDDDDDDEKYNLKVGVQCMVTGDVVVHMLLINYQLICYAYYYY